MSDLLRGGRADRRSIFDFDPVDLHEGAKHEMEHTADWRVAMEIASDHLDEDPDYYRKLAKMEAGRSVRMPALTQAAILDAALRRDR